MENIDIETLCNEPPADAWRDSQVREYRIAQRREDKATCRIIAKRLHAEGYAISERGETTNETRARLVAAFRAAGGTVQLCPPKTGFNGNPREDYTALCTALGAAGDCGECECCIWNRVSQ